jgi:hypothetical protein
VGDRRSGKSSGMARLAEQEAVFTLPIVVFDTQGDYTALANHEFFFRGVLVGAREMAQEYKRMRVLTLTAEGARDFGRTLVSEGLQAVIDLRYYNDDEAGRVIAEVINGIDSWERKQEEAERVPCSIYLDEAHLWVPQNPKDTPIKMRDETYEALCNAIFSTLVRMGGKWGMSLRLASQRIVEIDKRALQAPWRFIFRQSQQNDADRAKALGIPGDEIMTLPQGECFVSGPDIVTHRIKMYPRRSSHGGHTPGLENLIAHQRRTHSLETVLARPLLAAQPVPLAASIPLPAPAHMPVQREEYGVAGKTTTSLSEIIPFDLPEIKPIATGGELFRSEERIQTYWRFWQEGANSIRKLEDITRNTPIELSYDQARTIRTIFLDRKLITG